MWICASRVVTRADKRRVENISHGKGGKIDTFRPNSRPRRG